jgi:hypothetical protein
MTLQLVKVQDSELVSPIYYVLADGNTIPGGSTGTLQEAQDLYNQIVADPSYLTTRKQILESTNI